MNLVIVESPTKAKTISRYLPRDFKVESSYGHIRDLPAYELGVDVENDFKPKYVISKKSQPTAKKLKEAAAKAERLILATDEDREGEAIAWHILQALGLRDVKSQKSKVKSIERIVFHEITKKAIGEALKNPREIDQDRVDAQQARRILDRLVGYKLSPFLWQKVMRGLSAGRVQSVALRLIVEREEAIRGFQPETFWTIEADLQKSGCPAPEFARGEHGAGLPRTVLCSGSGCQTFRAVLEKINQKAIPKPGLKDKKEVESIINDIKGADFKIGSIEKRSRERAPQPPFTTSTLQQDAFGRLGYSSKKTMLLAQHLYETGFITYMRTDSVNIAEEALGAAKNYLTGAFGSKYALTQGRRFKTKARLAQEAHEAVRPTDPAMDLQNAEQKIKDKAHLRLYNLIWQRFMASQMPNAVFEETNILVEAGNKYELKSAGSILLFDGFLKVYPSKTEVVILPPLTEADEIRALKIESVQRETKGPARYSDATLVKELEKLGIGRPSTYAPIISTIEERGYVIRDEQKRLAPTEVGEKVNGILVNNFPDIVDVGFTRKMEEELDEIADGKKKWQPVLKEFYEPFAKNLSEKYESVAKEDLTEKLDRICPECSKPLVMRQGRYGKFIACSGFPACKYTEALPPKSLNIKCPLCKEGEIVERNTRRKRVFYGCSRWPDCDFATWRKPTGKLCPECGSAMVESGKRERCSNKSCPFRSGVKRTNGGLTKIDL